jgi:hypothetical protein
MLFLRKGLEHLRSKFERNAQSVSETSFLSIRIQNTTRLTPHSPNRTLVTTDKIAARNCFILSPAFCPVMQACSTSFKLVIHISQSLVK